jgi:choline kinase
MLAVILCAGTGSRTELNYPKCIHKLNDGSTLIEQNIRNLKKCGFRDNQIIFATGYAERQIKKITLNKYKYIKNKKFKSTNMIFSLNEVLKKTKSQDTYILYADIFYDYLALKELMSSKKNLITLVDKDWLIKWKYKKNFIDDLEILKIKKDIIVELGKKTNDIKKIDGRYIGITRFSKKFIIKLKSQKIIEKELSANKKLDFTSFLMKLINQKNNIFCLKKKIKWFEFDTKYDFQIFEKYKTKIIGRLN